MLKLLFIIPSCLTIFIFALFLMIISSSSDMNLLNNKNFLLPFSADTPYQLTSGFGWRRDPFDQTDDFHQGIDLATNKGTNILASASGTAYIVSNNKWYGNYIVLKHHFSNSVYYTVYMHLLDDSFQVKENEIVEQGQTIGLVGGSTIGWFFPALSTMNRGAMPAILATRSSSAPNVGAICTMPVPSEVVT